MWRVFGHMSAVNTASRRMTEKFGLVFVRSLRAGPPCGGLRHEVHQVIEGSEHGEMELGLTEAE